MLLSLGKMTIILCLLTVCAAIGAYGSSIGNGACFYDVTLQHEEQCGASGSTMDSEDDPPCCSTLQVDFLQLRIIVNGLTKQIQGIEQTLGIPSNAIDLSHVISSNATDKEKDLLQAIARTDAEIKTSQSNLAQVEAEIRATDASLVHTGKEMNMTQKILKQVRDKSKEDVDNLLQQITKTTHDANTCKTRLGMLSGITVPPQNPDAPVNLTYCSFEDRRHQTCVFVQDRGGGDDTEWYAHGGTVDPDTGPKMDHTYGITKGRYLYLNPKSIRATSSLNHTARMTSSELDPAPNYCIRFWYNMYGKDVQTLNMYAMIGYGRGYPVWSLHGNQGEAWHLGELELGSEYTGQHFKIVFEANHIAYYRRSSSSHGHDTFYLDHGIIAIDDIYFYNTTCNNLPTCPSGSYTRNQNGSHSCYTFHTTPKDWYKSYLTCHEEGATSHLVSVNTKDEHEYLVGIIKQDAVLTTAGSNGWFTSGNDEDSERHFVWTDTGTPYNVTYSDWYPGQPNNVGDNQDCLLLQYADDNYKWGDVACTEHHPFICEVDLHNV